MQVGIGDVYKKLSNEREFHAYWLSDSHSGLESQWIWNSILHISCPMWVKFGIMSTC